MKIFDWYFLAKNHAYKTGIVTGLHSFVREIKLQRSDCGFRIALDYSSDILLLDNDPIVLLVFDRICVFVVDSIGAQRVKNVCAAFRNFCEAKNFEG